MITFAHLSSSNASHQAVRNPGSHSGPVAKVVSPVMVAVFGLPGVPTVTAATGASLQSSAPVAARLADESRLILRMPCGVDVGCPSASVKGLCRRESAVRVKSGGTAPACIPRLHMPITTTLVTGHDVPEALRALTPFFSPLSTLAWTIQSCFAIRSRAWYGDSEVLRLCRAGRPQARPFDYAPHSRETCETPLQYSRLCRQEQGLRRSIVGYSSGAVEGSVACAPGLVPESIHNSNAAPPTSTTGVIWAGRLK